MNVTTLPSVPGARHRRKRVGRGIGSGHGKTSTRGQKGQRARTGSRKRPGFEGGRNPLIRRLPKRGFRQKATGRTPRTEVVNVKQLDRFAQGERVTLERLKAAGLIGSAVERVKLLGDGAVSKPLTVVVHSISESARAKIVERGGSVDLIHHTSTTSRVGSRTQPHA